MGENRQLHAVRISEADSQARNAPARIQQRPYLDNAQPVLPVAGNEEEDLLSFRSATRESEQQYGPFSEQRQLYGVPISVGGKRQIVNVRLQDGDRIHNCEVDRDVALRLAPLLFHHVRAYGTGRYSRNREGQWEMRSFRISHFDELDDRPLAETVERLRAVTRKVGLDRDVIAKLAAFRAR